MAKNNRKTNNKKKGKKDNKQKETTTAASTMLKIAPIFDEIRNTGIFDVEKRVAVVKAVRLNPSHYPRSSCQRVLSLLDDFVKIENSEMLEEEEGMDCRLFSPNYNKNIDWKYLINEKRAIDLLHTCLVDIVYPFPGHYMHRVLGILCTFAAHPNGAIEIIQEKDVVIVDPFDFGLVGPATKTRKTTVLDSVIDVLDNGIYVDDEVLQKSKLYFFTSLLETHSLVLSTYLKAKDKLEKSKNETTDGKNDDKEHNDTDDTKQLDDITTEAANLSVASGFSRSAVSSRPLEPWLVNAKSDNAEKLFPVYESVLKTMKDFKKDSESIYEIGVHLIYLLQYFANFGEKIVPGIHAISDGLMIYHYSTDALYTGKTALSAIMGEEGAQAMIDHNNSCHLLHHDHENCNCARIA